MRGQVVLAPIRDRGEALDWEITIARYGEEIGSGCFFAEEGGGRVSVHVLK